ncbi:hypothetical protein BTUL_0167g00200 [Botrytis tulipae]|uniref:Uncharacterized protein n=1 Tax=Botrytis tulipae TaxID=87230 RepID=A0A4Z1ED46_9HELO|nr:hypothetical protein BTUL_0167g00200 [Botrytis tulipae]
MAGSTANPATAWSNSAYPTVSYLVGKIFTCNDKPEALYVHGHLQEPVLGRLKGIEKGDPDIPVSADQ